MTTVLITGAFGYLGLKLSKFFSDAGYAVRMASRTKRAAPSSIERGVACHVDFNNRDSLDVACKDIAFILHLAGPNEIEAEQQFTSQITSFVAGTALLLESALRQNTSRFINFSTAHVYSSPLSGHLTEETTPQPTHPYGALNLMSEDAVRVFQRFRSMLITTVRLSNGYGAPLSVDTTRWSLLVNNLCLQAICNRKLVLTSHGMQYRDFLTFDDLSRSIKHLLDLPADQIANQTFNIGGTDTVTVLTMAERIAERCNVLFGFYPPIERKTDGGTSPADSRLIFDSSKLIKTGFVFETNFNKAIDETLLFCKSLSVDEMRQHLKT